MSEYRIKNTGFGFDYKKLREVSPCKVQVKTSFGWTTIKEFKPHEHEDAERLLAKLSGKPRFYVGIVCKETGYFSKKTKKYLGECESILPTVFKRGYGAIQQYIPSDDSFEEIKHQVDKAIELAEYLNSLDL